MREEIRKAGQMIINTYGGKYGDTDWTDCKDIEPFSINHTDGFTCTWKDYLVIAFRGSHGNEDWQDNFTFNKQWMAFADGTEKVHTGFKTQYFTVQFYLSEKIKQYNMPKLLICGHSLGGALASLCALDTNWMAPVTCVTWGSPRVGDQGWAKLFNKFVPDSLRYVYRNDIVTKVPTLWMNFKHVGNKIHLNPGGGIPGRIFGAKNDHYPQHYFKHMMEEI